MNTFLVGCDRDQLCSSIELLHLCLGTVEQTTNSLHNYHHIIIKEHCQNLIFHIKHSIKTLPQSMFVSVAAQQIIAVCRS